ncbi:cysteine--tRNA ligase [bacterium]|nr:cysteine--tRNA ligase [bacterium]
MLKIYNTLTQKKDEFKPLNGNKVGMYACGMTVYDKPHIGHARKEIAMDLVIRWLRYLDYDLTYVRNFTDVDDKIIQRANEREMSITELTEDNIEAFYRAVDALGLVRPDVEPKATEHIPHIIAMVEKLIENSIAYEVNGSVYFGVDKFKGYGKLSGRNIDDMIAGSRVSVEEDKQNPLDFVLWKTSKPNEPSWESPWGSGRPGWHIECSAMSTTYLGNNFDIHAGGRDLIFPHHENEIAQAEGATGEKFVNYWVHNGFLTVEGEKMSKSLNNFITVDDALQKYHPEVLRYFMLATHYRTPIDFAMSRLSDSERQLTYFYDTLEQLNAFAEKATGLPERDEHAEKFLNEFESSLNDDFNTPRVYAALFAIFTHLNNVLPSKKIRPSGEVLRGYQEVLKIASSILGFIDKEPVAIKEEIKNVQIKRLGVNRTEIETLIAERNEKRKERDFAAADAIRDKLLELKIVIKDTPQGTNWTIGQ